MTRAFVAIRPPPEVLDAIEARTAAVVMRGGRPTAREHWHLTLRFLGDAVEIAEVEAAFAREPLALGAGEVGLGGADALGNRRRARILALLLHEGVQWVRALAVEIERRLAPLGYGRDLREPAFVPHLTLARFREPTDLRRLCAAIGPEPAGPVWRVEEVVLYESVLRPQGAQHVVRACIPT